MMDYMENEGVGNEEIDRFMWWKQLICEARPWAE